MATDQQYKVPYPRAQAGPQVYDGRIHGMATIQDGHRPNLTHSATSAFRPAVMPHVPLQQRLVSPGVIPSNREQYHQQQTVPCGSSGKRAMHLELQQKQHQQQHIFQNLPSTSPLNRFQEISMDMHQRAALNPVQAVTPVQYRPSMQQYRAVQESSDREILHQELRMLHAVHYQDMNRKDELMETYLKQKLDDEKKQRSQAALAHHVMYNTQRKPQVLSDTVYRKKFIEDAHAYGHQPQRMYLPKQEELYRSRKARVPTGASLASSASQMMSYAQTHPEMRVRLDGAMPQSVPQAHLVQGIKENTSTAKNYHSYQIKERYGAHQQYQSRLPAQGATVQHLHVQHTHPEVFQTRRKQQNFPTQLHAANVVHPAVQHRPQKEQNGPLQYYQDIVMVEDDVEQVPVISHLGQLKQEGNVDKKASVDGRMHSLSGQVLKDRMCEEKTNYADDDSKESRRLSKTAVSIREEQMQLKEALVKSLHKAAVQNIQKEAKENTRDFTSHIVASSAGDIESMPRIVEVRSLANQEATPVVHRDATKGNVCGVPQGDVIGGNLKPSKPKSIMIKSHQELQEVPMNVNRVPSIGSMDSDNGRKDSWDSGIESPPWPENREACIMNMKRAAPFPCDDMALNSPHQIHRLKLVEKKQSDNSTANVGIDLSAKDQINVPSDMIPPVKESYVARRGNVAFCSPSPEALHKSRQLSNDEREKRIVSGGPLRLVNRKRSGPVDDVCPVENKVLSRDPQASIYSSLRRGSVPEEEMISKERMAVKSQPVEAIIVENESPLDLSCKKDQEETSSEIREVKETPLDENEVIIEKKPNVHEVSEDKGDSDNEVKKEVKCDGEEKNLTDTTSNEADERVSMSSDSPMQGYFCNIMMQALKRIWSESKAKLDVQDAAKDKSECVESSDEDSGKYFQPSSVTTLKHVPRVDSPDGLLLPLEDDPDKNMLPSSSSSHSLENALCLLMRQSSDAFKHGGDIFQHFDKMIKQELKVEIEKQLHKCNEDSTATETKQKDDPSASNSSDHSEVKPDEQTSEAVAVCSKNPNNVLSEEEIDDSQNLVIVESSISPKPSPDSQITEDKMEKVLVPTVISTVCEKPSPIAADSSVCESFTSPGQMYEKAARDAAQKAAHEAARIAAQKAAQASSAMKKEGLSQAQSKPQYVGEVIEKEVTSVETSLPQKPSPVTSSVQVNPKPIMYTGVQGHPRMNFHQVQNSGRASMASVNQPHSCPQRPQRPQYMGEELPSSTIEEEDARYRQLHPSTERRFSEPAIFNQNNTDKPQKIQRMQSSDTSGKLSVRNGQNAGPSSEKPSVGNTYHIIPQTVWQAQAQEPNSNKVKLMRVTSVPNKPVITLPGVPNAQDIQKQLQKSPIVLLPKLVCVPGQTYSQPTPIVGAQTYQTGNMVLLQNDNVQSAAPVLSSATVQVPASNAAHQSGSNAPVQSHAPEKAQSPELIDTIKGPFRIIQKTPIDQTSPAKKACVSAFIIIYKKISLPGVLRSGVPFVPPRLLQDGMFPDETFEDFCHALQDCNIMQRYMTVLERSALLNDLKHNKISSCKLVSLEEFHQKYDNIKVLIQVNKMT